MYIAEQCAQSINKDGVPDGDLEHWSYERAHSGCLVTDDRDDIY